MTIGYALPFYKEDCEKLVASSTIAARTALDILYDNIEANSRLKKMKVEISPFTDTINIFDSTIEDMYFFAKILKNEDYAYDPFLRMSSFYY